MDTESQTVFELQNAILKTVAELAECQDGVTGGHIERTRYYIVKLVELMRKQGIYREEIAQWNINLLLMSSQLHDVGKISIKDSILMKPGKLTDEEFEKMKTHCAVGVEIIGKIEKQTAKNKFLDYAKILAGTHHEKWDGSGYPGGLKGNEIPLQGRIMALVDVYNALTSKRPHRKEVVHKEAVEIIKNNSGLHFDPGIVTAFLECEAELEKARHQGV